MSLNQDEVIFPDGAPSNNKQVVKNGSTAKVLYKTDTDTAYTAGAISYDPIRKTHVFHTGFGIKIDAGEVHIPFFNDTGAVIANGKAVNVAGASPVNMVLKGIIGDSTNPILSSAIIGINSAEVADQAVGMATLIGRVTMDTSGVTEGGVSYLGTNGDITNTRPKYPASIVILGCSIKSGTDTTGIFQAQVVPYGRTNMNTNDVASSQGTGAGTFWAFGHYDWDTTSATLNQGSLTTTYGVADRTQAAHIGIVPSAAGTVDSGVVGLRVTGIMDSATGNQQAGQTAIISTDITTLTADTMAECEEKFSGNVELELYVVSGSPTAYSLTFNYGFSKYEDFFNRDATILGLQCRWSGDANDSSMNVELIPHIAADWTYAASGFVPGSTPLADRLTRQALAPDVDSGAKSGAWKVTELNYFLNSSDNEGFVVRITTTAANTFLTMNMTVPAVNEELI